MKGIRFPVEIGSGYNSNDETGRRIRMEDYKGIVGTDNGGEKFSGNILIDQARLSLWFQPAKAACVT
jgi:hypothetical protein